MKKYVREFVILLLQLSLFYLFPLFMYLYEPIGMVMFMLFATVILSAVLAIVSKNKIKYLYPIVIAVLFLPTVFIYYNDSALVHSLWYFTVSAIGMLVGAVVAKISRIS